MFKVKYLEPEEISIIENEWTKLEKGCDMSYFQSYTWYSSILPLALKDSWLYKTRVAIVFKDDVAILIAPLFFIKHSYGLNKNGVYFWGRCGWSDYLNFIYLTFDIGAYEFLVYDIKKKYHLSTAYWEQIKETTSFYSYLIQSKKNVVLKPTLCVSLQMPHSEKDYWKLLSKNTRQNLRTAINRLNKEGHTLSYVFDDKEADLKACESMRKIRVIKKNKPRNIFSLIKQQIFKHFKIVFPQELPFNIDKQSKMMIAYEGDVPRAFFNYGVNKIDNSIVLMAVGTDETFERYSPGMLLLYNFINMQISNSSTKLIDFTRGTERYKYALGGKEHTIYDIKVKI